MTRDELVEQLGQPSEKLSASIWLYFDLRAKGRPTGDQSDTLVVVFTHDRISLLRLTERSLIAPAIAKVRSNGSNGMAVARK